MKNRRAYMVKVRFARISLKNCEFEHPRRSARGFSGRLQGGPGSDAADGSVPQAIKLPWRPLAGVKA